MNTRGRACCDLQFLELRLELPARIYKDVQREKTSERQYVLPSSFFASSSISRRSVISASCP